MMGSPLIRRGTRKVRDAGWGGDHSCHVLGIWFGMSVRFGDPQPFASLLRVPASASSGASRSHQRWSSRPLPHPAGTELVVFLEPEAIRGCSEDPVLAG